MSKLDIDPSKTGKKHRFLAKNEVKSSIFTMKTARKCPFLLDKTPFSSTFLKPLKALPVAG
ncbi:hypothetical protein CYJ96_03725 [Moraxella osloensis]|uniref:Uncharacterized protein n=2 Tax=Pseudomonadota TaxID=1224 RepID=A0A2I1RJE6_FAUOS|nr:hypothetical protein AFK20_06350 [Enhydrobacter aerosaccus]PKZ69251.1 hypothetical protein CYJ96_03725 [Moraxella osloensis]